MTNDPQLYIVPTPIGNMEDITLRAIETLKNSDIILAEDTRHAKKLLKHYNISTKVISYHLNNEHKKVDEYVQMLINGIKVSLITDAGTPCISDPGFLLIREAIKNNILITCLPGPTAFVPALVMSGLPSDSFIFEGFLPRKKGRKSKLHEISQNTKTTILYESPFRIVKTLSDIKETIGSDRKIAIIREISKIYEEVFRGTIEEAIIDYNKKTIKGEFVICIDKAE
ncbi:MAG: 16S rRNA (cytidine(1402)-2'-O)-methyltransferase [Bacteroidetes bacterium]|nr:16S rRNA (cytidine(1402)-2'-O)-methyltransferase [Cryomorphaceae bacterium]MBL6677636.1 16S rRNA (cytidine(1402)-2'-O)-methyltransferase [Flavobacteriaceae bacterium]MDA0331231.1 16S rRNA (cytidine(1402)-2'-O)-methyltransferase [Bacteroidota bacterium]MDA0885258.1 16S rRNA (cytidine(1402)-2'-O)-methyltransferase [Bacteroidota bacterium]MDA1225850.1 16S rRNA (cytidine(1402)-2'-O)-methyltransferase [Bacteroidota bacterium]